MNSVQIKEAADVQPEDMILVQGVTGPVRVETVRTVEPSGGLIDIEVVERGIRYMVSATDRLVVVV